MTSQTSNNHSTSPADRARTLFALDAAPEILRVVNVWDVVSTKAVLALPETEALGTAGHSIAATFGYPDGTIPLELTLDMVGRVVEAAGDVPVLADLDDGYEDAGETTRRAIGVGIVGLNIEDRLRPVAEAAARVEAVVAAGAAKGCPFGRNARTTRLRARATAPPRSRSPTPSSADGPSSPQVPTSALHPLRT